MKKILVTGAGGYIGSICTYTLLRKGFEVVALDNFSTGFEQPLKLLQAKFGHRKLRYYECDLVKDAQKIFKKERNIEVVIHLAGLSNVSDSIDNPQKYFLNNVTGSYNLLAAMFATGVNKIVFSSTAAVYKKTYRMPVTEQSPLSPISPYGESKVQVEKAIEWFNRLISLQYIILRYFNVCGASEDGILGDAKKPSTALIQNAVKGGLNIEPFFLTFSECNTPDASPIRDYIDVVDVAKAHYKAIEYLSKSNRSEVINIGTGKQQSVLEIVSKVEKFMKVKLKRAKTTSRKGELPVMIASNKKARDILRWNPERTIEDSIKSLVKWYKKNPNGWER